MPIKIPDYQPQITPTPKGPAGPAAVEHDIRSFGVLELAAAQTWQNVGQMGQQMSEMGLRLNKAVTEHQEAQDYAGRLMGFNRDIGALAVQAKEQGDPDAWAPQFRDQAQTVLETALEGASPRVADQLKLHAAKIMPATELKLNHDALDLKISNLKANVPKQLNQAVQAYLDAPDEMSAATVKGTFLGLVRSGASPEHGYLKPEEAARYEAAFDKGVMLGRVKKEAMTNPAAVMAKLSDYQKNYPGMSPDMAMQLRGPVQAEMRRVQGENYGRYMQNILGATADQPAPGAVMPTEDEILGQMNSRSLNPAQAQNLLGYVRGQADNPDSKTDPQSYKEAVRRLTDTDNPLTREEFLKNVESGAWKFDAKTYGNFLTNINRAATQLEKAPDTVFKARLGFWKTQFGGNAKNEHFITALAQAQALRDAGELGTTKEEIYQNLDDIFKPAAANYAKENFLGTSTPAQPQPGLARRAWNWATGGSEPQAQTSGSETITKNGRTYRVMTINGQKVVDPKPLP